MTDWSRAFRLGTRIGLLSGATTSAAAAFAGRRQGSAAAAVNAPSHVFHQEDPAQVEAVTLRHTLPGYLVNTAAAIFWSTLFEKAAGDWIDRRGAGAAWPAAAAAAAVAYVTDYHVVPRQLRPGYERRVSPRGLFGIYAVLGVTLAAGALAARRGAGSRPGAEVPSGLPSGREGAGDRPGRTVVATPSAATPATRAHPG